MKTYTLSVIVHGEELFLCNEQEDSNGLIPVARREDGEEGLADAYSRLATVLQEAANQCHEFAQEEIAKTLKDAE